MRWRFLDDVFDLAARDRKIADIDAWWDAFQAKTDALAALFEQRTSWDLVTWMQAELERIHPELMWEYGPAVTQPGHRLVITPEHRYELSDLARTVVERAPRVDGWEFYRHRLAEPPEAAAAAVAGRTGGSLDGVMVAITPGDHHLIDLHYYSKSPSASHDAFVVTEVLLGEHTLNTWAGSITASRPKRVFARGMDEAVPVSDLAKAFEGARRRVLGSMSADPHHTWVPTIERIILKLQPGRTDGHAGSDDLVLANAVEPDLWNASHRSARFASERFSRQGETFAYVKIEMGEGSSAFDLDDRHALEDALDVVLVAAELGCVVGAGAGLEHAYIDLCFTDVEAGLGATRIALHAAQVPDRSWILFCDRVWVDEWIGVYEHTPIPPGRAN